jgi:hypothetical protein
LFTPKIRRPGHAGKIGLFDKYNPDFEFQLPVTGDLPRCMAPLIWGLFLLLPPKIGKNRGNFRLFLPTMKTTFFFGTVSALFFSACGSGPAFIAERSRSEALALKELCGRAEIQNPEISRADSLLAQSSGYWKQGEADKARQVSEEAIGLYRLALARDSKTKFEQELASAETSLAKDKERLETYREILAEMKTMRKP